MRTLTEYPDRATWLAARRLGASDVAAVLGMSRFKTPFDVWARIHGLIPPQPDNPTLARGRLFERSVVHLFSQETGLRAAPTQLAIVTAAEPFQFVTATPDMVVWADGPFVGETKTDRDADRYGDSTTFERWDARAARAVPSDYALQVYTQIWAAESEFGYLAVQLPFFEFRWFRFRRDPAVEAALSGALARWWRQHVEAFEPPATDASDTARRWLANRFKPPEEPRTATEEEAELAREFVALGRQAKTIEARRALVQNLLLERMAGANLLVPAGEKNARLTIVRSTAKSVDWKKVQADHPEVAEWAADSTTEIEKLPYLKPSGFAETA